MVRGARPGWRAGCTGGRSPNTIRSIAASQMIHAPWRLTGPAMASKCSPDRIAPLGIAGLMSRQLLVALGVRGSGQHEQRLGLVLGEQHLAVQLDRAELGMDERLVVLEAPGHLVPFPQPGELRARFLQRAHEFPGPRARPHRPVRGAQVRDLGAALPVPVVLGVAQPFRGIGEPAVDPAAGQARVRRLVAEQRGGHPVRHERLAEIGQDERRGVRQPVQHPQQRGRDVRRGRHGYRGIVPGHLEQVLTLAAGQPQRPRERGEHLLTRLRAAPLLEPGVVVDRHQRERRDLLTAQAPGPAARAGREPDVHRLQRLAALAQEAR
jgi:hypothetical protein